ncbi:hypothetical protein A3D88_02450 [Candidatus Peribacteria bacterium RIFCSPHIGHO2_02_FULL_52_16]|nr:MAG: hypothetical protein A2706_00275 [Candidatus Peribacteria bacterium RIFCSPHIGHO2_01_FULL_51_35]OGJ61622.1 MAG: hypothetical protein A3D88_02450 [Candidatus Peribacteria bacterium RIFCSPHIGHO2_02_FULL_52_16]
MIVRRGDKKLCMPVCDALRQHSIDAQLDYDPRALRDSHYGEAANHNLLLVRASRTIRESTVFHVVEYARGKFSRPDFSILVEKGKSHSIRTRKSGGQEHNPDGYKQLLSDLQEKGLHTIETTGRTGFDILQESVRHHLGHILGLEQEITQTMLQ